MALSSEFLPKFRSQVFSVQSTGLAWEKAYNTNPRDFTAEIIRYAEEMFMANEKSLTAINTTLDELETIGRSGGCILFYIVRLAKFFSQSVPSNR
jgi:hypothetical protein